MFLPPVFKVSVLHCVVLGGYPDKLVPITQMYVALGGLLTSNVWVPQLLEHKMNR